MSELVKRVARAMAESDFPGKPYEPFHAAWKERYERYARAAIEAMREPTGAMELAGHRKLALDWDMADGRIPPDIYRAMIDAALAPTEREAEG